MKRELREHIYIYISEISIDMNREFARSITVLCEMIAVNEILD